MIWQESRFQSDAVGPMTRSGQRAQGIAQFMPGTANERRLLDPFDPVQALPKSAEFLNELRSQFGNLGLAAAAYNAGPHRVQEWLAGIGRDAAGDPQLCLRHHRHHGRRLGRGRQERQARRRAPTASNLGCRELMALLRRAPNPFVTQLEQHVKLGAAKLWGVQLAAGFNRDKALAMYARAIKQLEFGDRRSGSEPAEFDDAQPRHPHFLSGADRRRHAPRCGRSLQPHPPRRRRLLCATEFKAALNYFSKHTIQKPRMDRNPKPHDK